MPDSPPLPISSPQRRRILVVDDARLAAFTLGKLLEALGHEVVVADSGAAALAAAQAARPDIVFTDLSMPDIDGYELLHRLRQSAELAQVPVVALTGYGNASDRKQTEAAGFHDHLVKPVSLAALQTVLTSLGQPPA